MKQKVPESGVLKACLDILGAHRIWHRRWNSGAVKTGKRFFRFGQKGDADILATVEVPFAGFPAVLWIECKSDTGKQTTEQRDFEIEVAKEGHRYIIVRKPEDLLGWLVEHGIINGAQSPLQGIVDDLQQ